MRLAASLLLSLCSLLIGCRSTTEPIAGHWQPVAQLPDDVYYSQIFFSNQSEGWVVGKSGRVLHTTDRGENWQAIQTGSTQDFHCLAFVDGQTGWIGGRFNMILRTSDAGKSWTLQYSSTDSLRRILSMSFVSHQQGWAVSNSGEILHTTGGGNSWQTQQSGTPWAITAVHFVDESIGWATSTNRIFVRTTDGGAHWESLDISYLSSPGICTDLKFIDNRRGWMATTVALCSSIQPGSPLLYSENSGTTWTEQTVLPSLNLTSLAVVYPASVWVAGDNQIFSSSDGGSTWGSQYRSDGEMYVSLSFTDIAHGWALSFRGTVLRYEL